MTTPAGTRSRPERVLPPPLEKATAGLFAGLSRLRGKRCFHPRGAGYEGTLTVAPPDAGPADHALARPGRHLVLIRLSRALGLPPGLPDVLGLALRIVDLHGSERHQDLLLVSAGRAPVARHVPLLRRGAPVAPDYSSLLLYRCGDQLGVFGARVTEAAGDRPAKLLLDFATPLGAWRELAAIAVEARLAEAATEALRFNPWNSGGGIRPAGPAMGVRRAAYAGSQDGRRAAEAAGEVAPEIRSRVT